MKYVKFISKLFLLAVSYLFIRNKKKWVFGSCYGFSGNPKYLFFHTSSNYHDIQSIWITEDKILIGKLRQLGFKAYYKFSLRGVWSCLTAGAYIYDGSFADINGCTFGFAKKINLWHGIGLKNMARNSRLDRNKDIFENRNPVLEVRHFFSLIKPDILLSTSSWVTKHFCECFGITLDKCVLNMYPRCEILQNKEKNKEFIKKYETDKYGELIKTIGRFENIFIYLPTWRDSGENFLSSFNFELLNEEFKHKNSLFLVKLHPNTKIKIDFSKFSHIKEISNEISDIYPILPYTDCLITDYSSILYDYILMGGKKVILYLPDFEEYMSKDRDLALPYNDYTVGYRAYNFEQLLESIDLNWVMEKKEVERITDFFWGGAINSTTDDLVKKLYLKLNITKEI